METKQPVSIGVTTILLVEQLEQEAVATTNICSFTQSTWQEI